MHDQIQEGLKRAAGNLAGTGKGDIPRPKNDDELHAAVKKYFGVDIPRRQMCEHHTAPFDAFADAFFARHTVSVWKASRGFGGKSLTLALLSLSEATFLGAQVNLLGGSGEQSERVLNYMNGEELADCLWGAPQAPRHLIMGGEDDGLQKRVTKLSNGGNIKALMASTRSVRGPHPQRLRLDEADEMDLNIFDSALGQPMARYGIREQVVASSTHHYSNGTMTEILKRASTTNPDWGVFEWCYKENLVSNGGWLDDEEVGRKRRTVTVHMWDTEYENQEPNPEGRAIDVDKCKAAFHISLGVFKGDAHERIVIEAPYRGKEPEPFCFRCKHPYDIGDTQSEFCELCNARRHLTKPGIYATGTDWAKKKDWTIIDTIRIDVTPAYTVAWERTGRLDWPAMTDRMIERVKLYKGGSAHDATGIGDVLGDYITVASDGIIMVGYTRYELLSHYINAIERGRLISPMIKHKFDEHRLASVEDVYKSGDKYHLPDSMAAGALAWKASGLGGVLDEIYIPGVNCMVDDVNKAREANK
jgi:hypothetical protein